jgi:hypothetical protein
MATAPLLTIVGRNERKGHRFPCYLSGTEFMTPEVKEMMKTRNQSSTSHLNPMGLDQSLGLCIPHRLQGLSISTGWFPIEIVWTARQIEKPYLCSNPTNTKTGVTPGIQEAGFRWSGCRVVHYFFCEVLINSIYERAKAMPFCCRQCAFLFVCPCAVAVDNGPLCAVDSQRLSSMTLLHWLTQSYLEAGSILRCMFSLIWYDRFGTIDGDGSWYCFVIVEWQRLFF